MFLYAEVLERPLGELHGLERVRRPARVPIVLNRQEVAALLAQLDGTPWLAAALLYGAGLRLMECLRLRVGDIDLERRVMPRAQFEDGMFIQAVCDHSLRRVAIHGQLRHHGPPGHVVAQANVIAGDHHQGVLGDFDRGRGAPAPGRSHGTP